MVKDDNYLATHQKKITQMCRDIMVENHCSMEINIGQKDKVHNFTFVVFENSQDLFFRLQRGSTDFVYLARFWTA